MTKKAWIIFAVLCIGLLGGLVWFSRNSSVNVDGIDPLSIQEASDANGSIADHVYGKTDSKVRLIEYGDYQCPGCASAYPEIKKVYEKYKDKIAFVFRNYPLTTIHPNALAAASTVEAAGLQGKFWEMHEQVYANQNNWKDLSGENRTDYFFDLARNIGVDTEKLKTDIDSSEVSRKISFDRALGAKQRVEATPTFYLNGKIIDQVYKDDKIVDGGTDGARQVWVSADAFDKLIIQPALKEAGIQ